MNPESKICCSVLDPESIWFRVDFIDSKSNRSWVKNDKSLQKTLDPMKYVLILDSHVSLYPYLEISKSSESSDTANYSSILFVLLLYPVILDGFQPSSHYGLIPTETIIPNHNDAIHSTGSVFIAKTGLIDPRPAKIFDIISQNPSSWTNELKIYFFRQT